MRTPYLRAILDTDETIDDPSEDALFELLSDISEQRALWVIVEKVADSSQQTFAQAVRLEDGSFQVERRLGSPASHQIARAPDLHSAHDLLTSWSFAL